MNNFLPFCITIGITEVVVVRMVRHCIVVLSGIPGSGKSRFISRCCENHHDNRRDNHLHVHIEYDRILSSQNERLLISHEQASDHQRKLWKMSRRVILENIDCAINAINNKIKNGNNICDIFKKIEKDLSDISDFHDTLRDMQHKVSSIVQNTLQQCPGNVTDIIWFIDDNMYYKSMRYEYYQLARQQSSSFAQIYMDCSLEIGLVANHRRKNPVPEDVVRLMYSRIEVPDAKENGWETHSIIINIDGDEIVQKHLDNVSTLIEKSLNDPLSPITHEATQLIKSIDRELSMKSILHQADVVLRKLVSKTMSKCDCSEDKMAMKQFASHVNQCRTKLYKSLQNKETSVPDHIHINVSNGDVESLTDFLNAKFIDML